MKKIYLVINKGTIELTDRTSLVKKKKKIDGPGKRQLR